MDLLAVLFTILPWLFLAVPIGILVAIFLIYRTLNKGNRSYDGPLAQPPSLQPWSSPPSPHQKYDPPPTHIQPPTNGGPYSSR